MAKWTLESIEISGGFLPGVNLTLPAGLTCIIGPRGSGKSTLMEAIRYGLSGVSPVSKTRFEIVQANLASAIVTLATRAVDGAGGYIVRRTFKEPPGLLTPQGAPVPNVNLDRGTFLPLDAYSSSEVEAIADETFGDKRRALLDDLRSDEMHEIALKVSEERRALEANADSIRAAQRLISDLTEQIEETLSITGRIEVHGHALLVSIEKLVIGAMLQIFPATQKRRQTSYLVACRPLDANHFVP